ncbi:3D-(3,5/4)-trihydroxycyclohexane-1,2-dione acylhydrolase (decyclizing) [Vagococcus intermedius]|uniref:3D-(3,5/4)-trihydroxycyclohexane-1,2-dione acylhydrolase (Decyclizing) n=1 Tax=Vagococcus intermedius TaxID=2991418 RepID=A0AAF0CT22_9ENTE|nr:3D-(3,5/4)-trihydroxycyclohexane-1,2-dione acylhydrolase (decyclizing) [Vagococcus intermedius]WEG72410.1 3D-(3,5/4)-trihydroxycyclohexane-1,2-dione acylhydrolase (decyclizing) [Vagococcus intermedius]WEG74498.1 3D-(3,5/4)-trihydroxycyclohexane-1,2-dione acylhydrolase (decyclizing) [Vagococcus intermedius]
MTKTIKLTTAQALIKFLNQQYIFVDGEELPFVEGIFHIYGHGNVLGIGEALENDPGHLKSFQGKSEQGMAHAAIAFSKQSLRKKIYAVSTSSGPGSANLLTAAGTAFTNNIPVLFLPADTFATRQPDPVLQQLEQPSSCAITTNDAFKPLSRYWDRVQRPEQLMSALIRAFEVMTNPETAGPATICISQDVEGEAFDYPVEFFNKRIHYVDRKLPNDREIENAISIIKNSKRPVIIVGGGAKYSEAREELLEISERYRIPLVGTYAGKSTVSFDFKYNLGGVGVLGTSAANQVVMDSDLIIGIGTRYSDFTTSSKTIFNFEHCRFLNINISRFQAYKFDADQIVGDAKISLKKVIQDLGEYQTAYTEEELTNKKEEWLLERHRLSNVTFNRQNFTPEIAKHFSQTKLNDYADTLKTELTQSSVFIKVNDLVDDNAIVVAAAGSIPGDMQRLWNASVENTYHLEYGYSTMGYEIAGALGAKLAAPSQESYAFLGDGSFLMLHTELVTALQYGQKINIILLDNSGYGCINNLQMEHGNGSQGTELRNYNDEIMTIDYKKIAEGYGMTSYTVTTMAELEEALLDSKKQKTSTLIDIKVLPKTMSNDCVGSWWHVGVADISKNKAVQLASEKQLAKLLNAKKY